MNIRSLRFFLTASLCAIMFFANHKQVVAQPQVEVPTDDEHAGEMAADANCSTENGECLNPDAETSTTTAVTATSEDPNCPSREHVIRCAGLYLDTNKNGYLERKELQDAIDRLPWYGRGIIKILGSVDKMISKCDIDGDGAISMDYDMSNNGHQCLATCFKRRAFKGSFFPDCQ